MKISTGHPILLLTVVLLAPGCDWSGGTKEQITKIRVEDWTRYFRIYHTYHPVPAVSMERVLIDARTRIQSSMSPKDRTPLSPTILEESLSDAWGHPLRFAYRAGDIVADVMVTSAGHDGVFDTPDDLISTLKLTPVSFANK